VKVIIKSVLNYL